MKHAGGRPSEYTPERVKILCGYLSSGMSLRTACKQKGMPTPATVFGWMVDKPEFLKQYEKAKQEAADALAEEIMDIADDAHKVIKRGAAKKASAFASVERLRVDTRKWIMAKMKPKKYGEKLDVTSDGKALPTPIYGSHSKPSTEAGK